MIQTRYRYFTAPDGTRWREDLDTGQEHPVTRPHDAGRDGDQDRQDQW